MGEMDTDTIGLIVLIVAVILLFVAAEAQKRKLGKMQRHLAALTSALYRQ